MHGGSPRGAWRQGVPRPPRSPGHPRFNNYRRGGQRQLRWDHPQNQGNFPTGNSFGQRGGGQSWPRGGGFFIQRGQNQQRFGGPRPVLMVPPPAQSPPRNSHVQRPAPTSPSRQFRNPSPDSAVVPSPLSEKERNESMFRNRSPPPVQSPPCKKLRVSEDRPGVRANLFEVPRPADPLTALDLPNSDDEEANSDDSESTVVYPTSRNATNSSARSAQRTSGRCTSATGVAPVSARRGSNDSNCSQATDIIIRDTPNVSTQASESRVGTSKTPQEEVSKSPPLSAGMELTELIKKKNIDVGPAQQNILRGLQLELAKKKSSEQSSASKENDAQKASDKGSPKVTSKVADEKSKKTLEKKSIGSKHQPSSALPGSFPKEPHSKKNDGLVKTTKNDAKFKSRDDQKMKADKNAIQVSDKKRESRKTSASHNKQSKTNTKGNTSGASEKKKMSKTSSSPSKKCPGDRENDRSRSSGSNDRYNIDRKHNRKSDSGHHKRNATEPSISKDSSKDVLRDDGVSNKDTNSKGVIATSKSHQHKEVLTELVMGTATKSYEDKQTSMNVVSADTMIQTERVEVVEALCQAVPEVTQELCQTEPNVSEVYCQTEINIGAVEMFCQTEIDVADKELQTEFQKSHACTQTDEERGMDQRPKADVVAVKNGRTDTETTVCEITKAPGNLEKLTLEHGFNCNALMKKLQELVESSKSLKPDQPEVLRNSIRAKKDLIDNYSRVCDSQLLRFEVANMEEEKIREIPHVNPEVLQLTETMANYFRLLMEMESADVSPEMRENKASLWNLSRLRIIRILRYGCGQQKSPLHTDISIMNILKPAFGNENVNENILLRCWDSIRNCSLVIDERSIDNEIKNIKFEGFQRLWNSIKPKILRKKGSTTTAPVAKPNPPQPQSLGSSRATSAAGISPSSLVGKGNENHHVEVTARTTEPGSYQLAITDTNQSFTSISPTQCRTPVATTTSSSGNEVRSDILENSPEVRQQGVTNYSTNLETVPNPQQKPCDVPGQEQQMKNVGTASFGGPKNPVNNASVSACSTTGMVTSSSTAQSYDCQPVPIPNTTSPKERRHPTMSNNRQIAGQAIVQRPMSTPSPAVYNGANYIAHQQIPAPLQNNNGFKINTYGNTQQQPSYSNGAYSQGYQNSGYSFHNPGGAPQILRHPNSYNAFGSQVYGHPNQQNQFPTGPPFILGSNLNNFTPTQPPNGHDPNVAPFEGDNFNYSQPVYFGNG